MSEHDCKIITCVWEWPWIQIDGPGPTAAAQHDSRTGSWFYTWYRSGSLSPGCSISTCRTLLCRPPPHSWCLAQAGLVHWSRTFHSLYGFQSKSRCEKNLSGVGAWWYNRAGGGGCYHTYKFSRSSSFSFAPTLKCASDTHFWSCCGIVCGHSSGRSKGSSGWDETCWYYQKHWFK